MSGTTPRTVSYTPFGKPALITGGGHSVAVIYGPNQHRVRRIDNNSVATTYVDGLYERVGERQRIYLHDFAVLETGTGGAGLTYLHRDHLGSIVAKSDTTATNDDHVEWLAYAAWGKRLDESWAGNELGPTDQPNATTRGFTGHEHLDPVGLIHMNGRVYDPAIGRFLSADPLVQAPFNTQSYNRYSYVFNNPLSFTDPSGFQYTTGQGPDGLCPDGSIEEIVVRAQRLCPAGAICFGGGQLRAWGDSFVQRQQDAAVEAGGFWGGVRYVGVETVYKFAIADALSTIDSTADGNVKSAVVGIVLTFWKPAKFADKALDLVPKPVRAKARDLIRSLSLGCSFVAGTQVLTPTGLVAIEELKPGDLVLARNDQTGEVQAKRIRQVFVNEHEDVLLLVIRQSDGDEEIIVTTTEHPFYAKDRGWVAAGKLRPADTVLDLQGEPLSIVSSQVVAQESKTYNFDVADFNSYAVGESEVWVHNGKGPDCVPKTAKSSFQIAKEGGKHAGFLKNYVGRTPDQIRSGIASLEKQIADHRSWIANPRSKIPNFGSLDPRQQAALINSKWPGDIARQQEQLDILRGLLGGQ